MDLKVLRWLDVLAQEEHFGRAAERLYIAQPHLSEHIRRLERELGGPIFERTSRGAVLTPAGRVVVEEFRKVLHVADAARRRGKDALRGFHGDVSIGVVPGLEDHLPAVLEELRATHPELAVSLVSAGPGRTVDGLVAGRFAAGFDRLPGDGDDDPPHVEVAELWTEPWCALVPAGHPAAAQAAIVPLSIVGLPLLLTDPVEQPEQARTERRWVADHGAGAVTAARPNDPALTAALVAAGQGWVLTPRWRLPALGRRLVAVPLIGAPTDRVVLLWRCGEASMTVHRVVAGALRVLCSRADAP